MESTTQTASSSRTVAAESSGDFSTAEPVSIFDEAVTNAVTPVPGRKSVYQAVLSEDWFNDNGTAFGGYVLALSTRSAFMHLADTGDLEQFPHNLSIQAQFISANQPGWVIHMAVETIKTGKNIAYLQLRAVHAETNKIVWMISYVFGSLTRHRLPVEWEVAKAPPMPAPEDCKEFKSPFKSKFGEFKVQLIPRGTNPFRNKERVAAYMGFSDGRPIDMLSLSLFADLFTDHRMFRQIHRPRDEIVRIGKDGKVPRGKIGIRTSGTISMSVHFFK